MGRADITAAMAVNIPIMIIAEVLFFVSFIIMPFYRKYLDFPIVYFC